MRVGPRPQIAAKVNVMVDLEDLLVKQKWRALNGALLQYKTPQSDKGMIVAPPHSQLSDTLAR